MTIQQANISLHMDFSEQGANAFGGPFFAAALDFAKQLTAGVAAGQADLSYVAERTVTTGANDDIDLNGVLTGALGNTISALKIVGIAIINRQKDGTANTTALTLGGGSNPVLGLFNSMVLKPGAMAVAFADDVAGLAAIVAATGDIFRIANGAGATNKYQIMVLGRSS